MDFGAMMFSTDYSIRPDDQARLLEDRGVRDTVVPVIDECTKLI